MKWRLFFSGTQSAGWLAAAVISVVMATALCLWLLKVERRMVSATAGRLLTGLRIAVFAMLLLTMLQPVLTRRQDVSQQERLVVAVDASGSMDTQDRHAASAEKLRWAQALGMLGSERSAELIAGWVTALENRQEPDWLGSGKSPATAEEETLANARRQQVTSAMEELGEMTRLEFSERLLQSQPLQLLTRLSEEFSLDVRLFASKQQPIADKQFSQALQADRSELQPEATDIVQVLNSAVADSDGHRLKAVVLLTDGRQTVPADALSEARRMGTLGIPVYCIPVGSQLPPRDLSVTSVDCPETVFVNDVAHAVSVLNTAGFEGQELTVRLEQNGKVIDQQTITPAGDSAVVRFRIPSTEVGQQQYQISTDVAPGEISADNNQRTMDIQVVDNKARVMLMDGDARWEFRYLKNLLERDDQIELQTVLTQQPWMQLLNEPFIERSLPDDAVFQEKLTATDVLILGDMAPEQLSEAAVEHIEKAVSQDGLTVVVIPGKRHMPHRFQSNVLNALLPVEHFQQRLAEQFAATDAESEPTVFQLVPTSDGAQLPMFQLIGAASPESSVSPLFGSFDALPGHTWLYTATPRLSATVWATSRISRSEAPSEATIVHQYYGFGQVVWMGVDSTWRWRRRAGDSLHHRFWGQLIRWATRNKAAAGDDRVRFTLSDIAVDQTETVEVVARWNSQFLQQLGGGIVEAVITQEIPPADNPGAGNEKIVVLQSDPAVPERFTGRLPKLTPGNWRVRLRVRDSQLSIGDQISSMIVVRPQVSAELATVSCNREFLHQLADLSGGAVIEPFRAEQLLQLIKPDETTANNRLEERTLWDHWALLVLFFALLMSEWVLRKLNGLP